MRNHLALGLTIAAMLGAAGSAHATTVVGIAQQGRSLSAAAGLLGGTIVRDNASFPGLGFWSRTVSANSPASGVSTVTQQSTIEILPAGQGVSITAVMSTSATRLSPQSDGGATASLSAFITVTGGPAEVVIDAPFSFSGTPSGSFAFASMYGPTGEVEVFDWSRSGLGGNFPDGQFRRTLPPGGYGFNVGMSGSGSTAVASLAELRWTMRVAPVGVVPCRTDFNSDGQRTPADIFAFLNAYFANDPRADFDTNGVRQPADLFAFLNAYFAGGC
jgi:hypothetical protein